MAVVRTEEGDPFSLRNPQSGPSMTRHLLSCDKSVIFSLTVGFPTIEQYIRVVNQIYNIPNVLQINCFSFLRGT